MTNTTKCIVFIDAKIDAPLQLATGIALDAEVLIVSPAAPGVEQITVALKTRPQVSEIYLIAHGSPGCLHLGTSELGLHTLDRDRALLQQWFAPVPQTKLHLYGCNVAAGDAGAEFLTHLAQITGAAIAASTHPIGSHDRGGSWHLDTVVGDIPTSATTPFTPHTLQTYGGLLMASANDNFANAINLTPGTASNGDTGGTPIATHETGEPIHDNSVSGLLPEFQRDLNNSIWWRWTATLTGEVNVSVREAVVGTIDTVVAVYTGTAVNNLSLVAKNDNAGPGTTNSSVTFNVVSGTTYYFAVDGVSDDVGAVSTLLDTPPVITPNQSRAVSESVLAGAAVGTPITLNVAEPVTWAIASGNPDNDGDGIAAFNIAAGPATTAQITVADPDDIDFEAFGAFYTLNVTAEDASGFTDTEAVFIEVTDAPEAPELQNLTLSQSSINEGGSITLSGDIFDPDLGETQTLTVTWGDGTPNTIITSDGLVDDGAGTKSFSLNHIYREDNNGAPFTINVSVTDGTFPAVTDTRSITVNNVAPTITQSDPLALTLNEDASVTFSLSATDPSTADRAALDWSVDAPVTTANGTVTRLSGGTGANQLYRYTPNANFSGTDSVQIQVADPDGANDTISVEFEVTAQADAPVLTTPLTPPPTINQGETTIFSGSFVDPDVGDTFTVTIDWGDGSTPTELETADLTFNAATNTYSFSAEHEYLEDGSLPISVTVRDSFGSVSTASTTATVNNVLPTLTPSSTSFSIDEGESGSITFTASDFGDTSFNWDLSTLPVNGTVTPLTGTGETLTFTYTPNNPNFSGTDSFVVRVDDDGDPLNGATTAAVTVGINPVNDAPTNLQVTTPTFPATVNEGETFTLSGTFEDVDNTTSAIDDTHTVTIDWGDGTSIVLQDVDLTNTQTLTPGFTANHTYLDEGLGFYEVTITAEDEAGESFSITREITVNNVDPLIVDGGGVDDPGPRLITVAEDNSVTFTVSAIDVGPDLATTDTLNWSVSTQPTNGSVNIAAPGTGGTQSFTYTPNPDFDGTGFTPEDTFTIQVSDGDGGIDTLVVNVDITPDNDAPQILVNNFDVVEGEELLVNTSVLDAIDLETTADANLTFAIIGDTSVISSFAVSGTPLSAAPGNTFTRDDLINDRVTFLFNGETAPSFTITVTDDGTPTGTPRSTTRQAVVSFTETNDAPALQLPVGDAFTVTEGSPALIRSININAQDDDAPSPADLEFTVANVQGGSFRVDGNERSTFTLEDINSNRVTFLHDGTETPVVFDITVSDGELSDTQIGVTAAVNQVNDRPEILVNNFNVVENETLIVDTSVLDVVDAETTNDAALNFQISGANAGDFSTQNFTRANLLAGTVTFTYTGETRPSFSITVTDDGTPTGTPASITQAGNVTFTAENDAPIFDPTDVPFTITEGGNVLVRATNISATDNDDTDLDLEFTITNLVGGEFRVNGTADNTFTQRELSQNLVRFFHDGSDNAPSYTVTVSDDEGATATRNDVIPPANFNPINDRPEVLINEFNIVENETLTLDTSVLDVVDAETDLSALNFTITSTNPDLTFSSTNFNGAALQAGTVSLTYTGETLPSFSITVSDDGTPTGTVASTTVAANVTFTGENDAPVFDPADVPFTITEGGSTLVRTTNISATDNDDTDLDLEFTITNLVGGEFRVNGTADNTFTQRELSQNLVRFFHDGSDNAPSYTVTVSDDEGATATRNDVIPPANFNQINDRPEVLINEFNIVENQPLTIDTSVLDVVDAETDITALNFTITSTNPELVFSSTNFTGADLQAGTVNLTYTGEALPSFSITVADDGTPTGTIASTTVAANVTFTGENDAPVFDPTDVPFTITEGGSALVRTTNISATDADDNDPDLLFTVSNVVGGEFRVSGTADNTFTQRELSQNLVRFFHNGSDTAPSYTVTVSDDGGATATRNDVIPPANFNPINDRPEILINEFNIVENQPLTIDTSVLDVVDAETDISVLNFTITSTNPDLTFSSTNFTGTQLQAGAVTLTYTGETAPSFSITVTDDGTPTGTSASTTVAANVIFTSENDAPIFDPTDVPFTITEGGNTLIRATNISATDADDNDPDLLFTVSNVVGGEFRVNGTADNTFTQLELSQNLVRFFHNGSETAPSYTVTVSDDDGATATRNDVIPPANFNLVNDRPTVLVNSFDIVEDEVLQITTDILDATEPEAVDNTQVVFNILNLDPVNGTFQDLLGATTSFSRQQILDGEITFLYTTEVPPDFDIRVLDTTAPATNSTTVAANIDSFTTVNDAPVIVDVNTTFPNVTEGDVITLTGGTGNIFDVTDEETDAIGDPSLLEYTIDSVTNGEFQLNGVATTTFTQQDILDGNVDFVHDASDETEGPSFTFTLSDNGSPDPETITQTVTPGFTPENDAPVLGNNQLAIAEGETVVLRTANLSALDAETDPVNLTVTITNITNGTLTANGVTFGPGAPGGPTATFVLQDVIEGRVSFTHDATSNDPPSYDVQVSDDGDLGDGTTGTPLSDPIPPEAVTVTFTEFNDAPILVGPNDPSFTVDEGGSVILNSTFIEATDEDNPPAAELEFTASNVVGGFFARLADPNTPITEFTQDDINNGRILFVHDDSDTDPTYTLTVSDGEKSDTASYTAAVNLLNDAPTITVNELTINEGETVVLGVGNLLAADEESGPLDLQFEITSLGSNTAFIRDPGGADSPILLNGTFTLQEVLDGNIAVRHLGDVPPQTPSEANSPPEYTLTVTDQGGVGLTSAASIADITFSAENDPPVLLINDPFGITQGQTASVTGAVLSVEDEETTNPANIVYTVTTVENGGFLLNGSPTTSFTQADLNNNRISFDHDGSEDPPAYTLTVSDSGVPTAQTITLNSPDFTGFFTNQNDPPTLLTNTLAIAEGATVEFTTANLNASDLEDPNANLLFTVTNIQNGTFDINGTIVGPAALGGTTDTGTFTLQDIIDGTVSFTDDGTDAIPDYDVQVEDSGVPATPPGPLTDTLDLTVNFTRFNDAPTLTITAPTNAIGEGGTISLEGDPASPTYNAANDLLFVATDEEADAMSDPSLLVYTVDEVANGVFQVSGVEQTTFTQQDILNGDVVFVQDGTENPPTFTVTLSDSDVDEAKTVTVADVALPFVPDNNPPTITVNQFALTEGETTTLSLANLNATDEEDEATQLQFSIDSPTGVSFFLDGNPLGTDTFTLADLEFGNVTVRDDIGDETLPPPSFNIVVTDTDSSGSGGVESTTVAAVVTINPVNDTPTIATPTAIAISEDGIFTLNEGAEVNIQADDEESGPTGLTFTVDPDSLVAGRFVRFDGTSFVSTTSFTQDDIDNERVVFEHDGSETAPSFTLVLSDDGNPAGTVTQTFSVANGLITFTPVNDAPVATDDGGEGFSTNEDTVLTTPSLILNDGDDDGDPLTVTELFTGAIAPAASITLASGSTVTINADNTLTYTPGAGLNALPVGQQLTETFQYTVSDGTATDTGTVTILVNGVNDAPTAVDDGGTPSFEVPATDFTIGVNVLTNDTDPDTGDTLTILSFDTSATQGSVVNVGNGNFDYNPNGAFNALAAGESATDSFTYTVSDGNGGTDTATVTFVINGVDNPPTAIADTATLSERFSRNINVLANDSDPDSPPSELSLTAINGNSFTVGNRLTLASGSQVIVNANNTVTYLPISFGGLEQGQTGTDNFTYTVEDAEGNAATATVNLTINGYTPPAVNTIVGLYDYEYFLREQTADVTATVPTDSVDGLPLAQLFDENFYLSQYSDVSVLVSAGILSSGYQHFVSNGISEGRNPSILYNEAFYLANNPDVAQAVASGSISSGLRHFLTGGHEENRSPSSRFNQPDYLTNNPDVAAAVNAGSIDSGFQHYIAAGANENRLPFLSLYNEAFYLANNPDVAQAVTDGLFTDGFTHFIIAGQREGRAASPIYSESSYLANNPDIASAINAGVVVSGFQHYEAFGRFEGRTVFG